jgi:hypothetical protein
MKSCKTCGTTHDGASWSCLKLCGYQPNGRETAGEIMELRLCSCGSSLAMDFGDQPDSVPNLRRAAVRRSTRSRPPIR